MSLPGPAGRAPSFHDNLVYAFRLRGPDPDNGDWASELVLDIDHIVEWVCGAAETGDLLIAGRGVIDLNWTIEDCPRHLGREILTIPVPGFVLNGPPSPNGFRIKVLAKMRPEKTGHPASRRT